MLRRQNKSIQLVHIFIFPKPTRLLIMGDSQRPRSRTPAGSRPNNAGAAPRRRGPDVNPPNLPQSYSRRRSPGINLPEVLTSATQLPPSVIRFDLLEESHRFRIMRPSGLVAIYHDPHMSVTSTDEYLVIDVGTVQDFAHRERCLRVYWRAPIFRLREIVYDPSMAAVFQTLSHGTEELVLAVNRNFPLRARLRVNNRIVSVPRGTNINHYRDSLPRIYPYEEPSTSSSEDELGL